MFKQFFIKGIKRDALKNVIDINFILWINNVMFIFMFGHVHCMHLITLKTI
jgi:hypothetical protein